MAAQTAAANPTMASNKFERLVVGVIGAGLLFAVAGVAWDGLRRLDIAAAYVGVIAIGELMYVRLPGNRPAAPIASAGALGYALLFDVGGHPIAQSTAQVVVVVAVGCAVGAVIQVFGHRRPQLSLLARRILLAAVAAVAFHLTAPKSLSTLPLATYKRDLRWVALLMVTIVALAVVVDIAIAGAIRATGRSDAFGWAAREETRSTAGLWAAVGATGVLTALATPSMKLYAVPTFCVPLLLTQFAFRRYAAIRTTYRQTIRSLSRVTEVGGYVQDGHGHRVSVLAVAIGRELGLSENDLVDLEYAALLHDIGQLSLTDPIRNGSTLVVAPNERQRVAALGADVIKTTGVLDHVAGIVARQADPYRRHREPPDETLPIESRIIKAASAYDDLVGGSDSAELSADALERLRLGMAYEYDPVVVETLTRVVQAMERSRQISA